MQRKWWAAAALAMLALVSGCHKGGSSSSTTARFLSAVVDAEPLDFLIDDSAVARAVSFSTASSFVDFSGGSRDLKVRSSTSQGILVEKTVAFTNGANSTLIAHGKRASIQTLILAEDVTAPASGQFQVRAVGLSADAGTLDLYLATGDIATAAPTISSLTYGTATAFTSLSPGTFNVVVTTAGTKDIVFQSTSQTFAAGASVTFATLPASGGKLVNVMMLNPPPGGATTLLANPAARVKAVNAVPDSTALTFKANGTTLLSSVPFTAASSYVSTTAGARTLQVEASNVPGTTLASLAQTLDPARDYTLLAANRLAQIQLVAFADDNTIPSGGFARVRFANAMVGSTTVDALVNFASQATGIAFAGASGYYQLAAATDYTITFATAGGVQTIATLTPVELDAGNVYTLYLLGTTAAPQVKLVRDR